MVKRYLFIVPSIVLGLSQGLFSLAGREPFSLPVHVLFPVYKKHFLNKTVNTARGGKRI